MFPGETILSGAPSHEQDQHISEFKVLMSGADYYIGTMYKDDSGVEEPNSRETDYFGNRGEAEIALETYKKTGKLPKQRY